MKIAYNEIEKVEEFKRLSNLEKNRIALKFVEMNSSPERYKFFDRFKEENIKKIRFSLNKKDLKEYYKIQDELLSQTSKLKSKNDLVKVDDQNKGEKLDNYRQYISGDIITETYGSKPNISVLSPKTHTRDTTNGIPNSINIIEN